MARLPKMTRPGARVRLGGDVLLETSTAIVMRAESRGSDARSVLVIAADGLPAHRVADELRTLARLLGEQAIGLSGRSSL